MTKKVDLKKTTIYGATAAAVLSGKISTVNTQDAHAATFNNDEHVQTNGQNATTINHAPNVK